MTTALDAGEVREELVARYGLFFIGRPVSVDVHKRISRRLRFLARVLKTTTDAVFADIAADVEIAEA